MYSTEAPHGDVRACGEADETDRSVLATHIMLTGCCVLQCCRPLYPGCADTAGWESSTGLSCNQYLVRQLCTRAGKEGRNWDKGALGSIGDYAVGGVAATQACCACGGGDNGNDGDVVDGEGNAAGAVGYRPLDTALLAAEQCEGGKTFWWGGPTVGSCVPCKECSGTNEYTYEPCRVDTDAVCRTCPAGRFTLLCVGGMSTALATYSISPDPPHVLRAHPVRTCGESRVRNCAAAYLQRRHCCQPGSDLPQALTSRHLQLLTLHCVVYNYTHTHHDAP